MAQASPEKTPERTVILSVSEEPPPVSSCLWKEILLPASRGQNDWGGVFSGLAGCDYVEKYHFTQRVYEYELVKDKRYPEFGKKPENLGPQFNSAQG